MEKLKSGFTVFPRVPHKRPFEYYDIIFLTFLDPPTHLFDDVILEWSLIVIALKELVKLKIIVHQSKETYKKRCFY